MQKVKVIEKTTTKGQITLPKFWRDLFETQHFLILPEENQLVIRPLILDDDSGYATVFNAERDNKGKGISAKKILKILKEVDG